MARLVRVLFFFVKLGLSYICSFIAKLFNPSYRNLWIISERGDDARDNGFFFYKYLREVHPELNVVYSINRESADLKNIQLLGKWVDYNSFKHFLTYAASTVRIGSSMWGGDLPYAAYFEKIHSLMSRKRKFVYLKHGIDKDFDPSYMAEIFHPDLIICGARPEYEYLAQAYHHPAGVVQYTGLARFDNLHNISTKEQILFMPTFRMWLQGKDESEVATSEFVQRWNTVLNNPKLNEALEVNNLELIFYPHYVMQKYVDLFHAKSNRIKIARFEEYDVQQLLIESKLLVTDFSSVFFDFGYMNKPVLYYQFDRSRYIKEHYDYTRGYFSYDRDGFGEIVYDESHLIELLRAYIESDFIIPTNYQQRIDKFFVLKDNLNCDRIYRQIMRVVK